MSGRDSRVTGVSITTVSPTTIVASPSMTVKVSS